jgi:hypothetical protein
VFFENIPKLMYICSILLLLFYWDTQTTCEPDREIQQGLADLMGANNLTQIHDSPTRENNLLDLVFVSNPTLVKSSVNVPGISDHEIIITDYCFPELASRVFGLGCSHPLGQLVLVVSLCLVHMLFVCPILCTSPKHNTQEMLHLK